MNQDRTKICEIIGKMLDNPDEVGIYPTTDCYDQLEAYIARVRGEALGWMFVEAISLLEKGQDLRHADISEILERSKKELDK